MRHSSHVPPSLRAALGVLALGAMSAADIRAQDGGFSGDGFPSRSFLRAPIFFPPNPPPLGRAIPATTAPAGRFLAPPELAAYVNEPFYPQLGSRLHAKSLTDKLRAQLDQYRAAKRQVQTELRDEIEKLRDAEPAERVNQLTALARRQAPRLLELERNAEQLRRDLQDRDQTWSALREWRLGDNPRRAYSPLEIAQVMRSYAFYQAGLLPAQRRLLREISLELQMAEPDTATATVSQPHLFFPPEPARVLLPDNAPAEVAAKMAAYQTKKSQLKKELYDTIYSHDGERFSFLSGTLKKLVERQTARIAELEKLAEEIRVGLTAVPEPPQISERSALPARLQSRVADLVAALGAAQKEANAALQSILARNRNLPMQTSHRFDTEGLKYVVIARGGRGGRGGPPPSPEDLKRIEAVRAEHAAVADTYGRKLAEVLNEKDAIAKEVGETLGLTKPEAINTALVTAIRVATAKESEGAYRDYRVAVFQPGLSPEQRRLLFDGVIERLELPLPRGELQPVQRGSTW